MNKGYSILSLEAKDLYGAMNPQDDSEKSYRVRDKNGNLNYKKFVNTFDWSLDAIKLQEVYTKVMRRKDFSHKYKGKQYTQAIINITFNYSYKEFNKAGKNAFVRAGYTFSNCEMKDGVCIKDGKLVAIQTNVEINDPLPQEVLGKNFTFSEGFYEQVGQIPTLKNKSELRQYLYENGFVCDGIKYVRYKRSSGSSRVGKCLFINEALADKMSKWDRCGLSVKQGDKIDLAAYEAYISLPMSSIIDTMEIQPENFLVIDDYDSVFKDEVVAVEVENNKLVAEQKEMTIKNSLWDGESLMDKSLFNNYEDKGMLLLRNRFFKTCAFNTNLQQWFADNNITSVEQLNGFTLATDISQIKIITTPSSIKFAKFGEIKQWLQNVDSTFGIVKHEKETHYFDGRMVQSHYQLFNTCQLTYEEMERILMPSLDYMKALRSDPDVLRYHIKYPYDEDDEITPLKSKNEIIFKLLGINNKFAETKMYQGFRNDLIKGFIRNLKQGHVLLKGNYSTLLGNGLEMLNASIGKFDGNSVLSPGSIHSTKFPYGTTVLGSRSPHVTMGNILLVQNEANADIDRYFNLTNEIVYVNAINENIQQRLNGADYDSDTMLLTDNIDLINAAQKNYSMFKVPTNFVESTKTQRYYTWEHKADLDIRTSVNKIGEIINLSQQLNSLLWDRVNNGTPIDECRELYNDICKLAVLSNIEIDKAKKEFVISSTNEIATLKEKYKIVEDHKTVKPNFFKMITLENGYELSDNIKYKYFKTSMDYLQKIISSHNFRQCRAYKKEVVPFMEIVKKPEMSQRQGYYCSQRDKIINIVREAKEEIRKMYIEYDTKQKDEKQQILQRSADRKQECVEDIEKITESPYTMYLTLKELDNKEYRDVSRFMFEVFFGKPNESFFKLIDDSKEQLYSLEEDEEGDITLYDFKFKKQPLMAA